MLRELGNGGAWGGDQVRIHCSDAVSAPSAWRSFCLVSMGLLQGWLRSGLAQPELHFVTSSCDKGGQPEGQAGGQEFLNPLCLKRQLEVEFCPCPDAALTQDLLPWSVGTALMGVLVFEGLIKLRLCMKLGFMKTSLLLLKPLA